jgi:hypothetical protein
METAMYAEILGQLQDITWLNSKSQNYISFNQLTDFPEAFMNLVLLDWICCDVSVVTGVNNGFDSL